MLSQLFKSVSIESCGRVVFEIWFSSSSVGVGWLLLALDYALNRRLRDEIKTSQVGNWFFMGIYSGLN